MGSKCVFAIRFSFTRMKHLAIWTVNLKKKSKKGDQLQSLKWKFEFTGPYQILKFIFIYSTCSSFKKMKNLLVQTKFYWSWAGGPLLNIKIAADNSVIM
jgi:hypothetical protein